MKTRIIVIEVICWILLLNFFYEGVYKLIYFHQYALWLRYEPFQRPVTGVLAYVIPIGEILLSFLFLIPSCRVTAFYISIIVLVGFVIWIMSSILFTHTMFWPYHALWDKPTWIQKILIWLSFMAIILYSGNISFKRFSSNSLRNSSAWPADNG